MNAMTISWPEFVNHLRGLVGSVRSAAEHVRDGDLDTETYARQLENFDTAAEPSILRLNREPEGERRRAGLRMLEAGQRIVVCWRTHTELDEALREVDEAERELQRSEHE